MGSSIVAYVRHHGGQFLPAPFTAAPIRTASSRPSRCPDDAPAARIYRTRVSQMRQQLDKDGFNIPFETFLRLRRRQGPRYRFTSPANIRPVRMRTASRCSGLHVFRAGTIGTVAEKTAFGYVKKYLSEGAGPSRGGGKPAGCRLCRRQANHWPAPGGLVVIPQENEIWDFCPGSASGGRPGT